MEPDIAKLLRDPGDNPISRVLTGAIRDGVNDGVKRELDRLVEVVVATSGLRAVAISQQLNKPKPTVERHLRLLKTLGLIEFRGVPKTGGYYITEDFKKRLER